MAASRKARTSASFCPDCNERIIWARTEAGENQALNLYPNPAIGSVWAHQSTSGWRARSMVSGPERRHPLEKAYMPHAATCPGSPEVAEPPSEGDSDG